MKHYPSLLQNRSDQSPAIFEQQPRSGSDPQRAVQGPKNYPGLFSSINLKIA